MRAVRARSHRSRQSPSMPGGPPRGHGKVGPAQASERASNRQQAVEESPEVTGSEEEDDDVGSVAPSPREECRRPPQTPAPKSRLYLHLSSIAARSVGRPCGGGTADGPASFQEALQGPDETRRRQQPPKPRRELKLTDGEILNIYRSAQLEAGIEADWLGIQGPKPCIDAAGASPAITDGSGFADRRHATPARAPCNRRSEENNDDLVDAKQECLRILSRALQQPGGSPGSLAAQLTRPQTDALDQACCSSPPKVRLGHVSYEFVGLRRECV